jgi:hypothetical protein
VDYRAACDVLVQHQPQHRLRLLRRVIVERCRACREPWPCHGRRQARHAILEALNTARHS